MTARYDAIVIGAGANGLVTAHRLARRGRRVLVIERQRETEPGLDAGWVLPRITRDLDLPQHGLRVENADPWLTAQLEDGGRLVLWHDVARTVESLRPVSAADAAAWPAFASRMRTLARFLEDLYRQPAPDVETQDWGELLRLGRLGLHARRFGRQAIVDLLRILPMSVADLLDEWFETDALKGALAAGGIMHLSQGPRSGGTAFNLLHHHVGSPAGVFRPARSNLREALTRIPGVEVRRGAEAIRIRVTAGRAAGVVLAGGEEIDASVVASSADPRQTLLRLVEADWLDPMFLHAVRNIKCRGVAAGVTFTLERAGTVPVLCHAPSLEYLERAYDDAKYGHISRHPYVEARATDHRLDAHVQYAPYAPREGGWDDVRRTALGDAVREIMAGLAPDLMATVTGTEVLSPVDLEARYGVTEGQLYHGEHTLDQILFMRPVAGWSRYRTPVTGLYLCGAGTHPGGAIAGGSGTLAADVILEDTKR